MKRPQFSLRLLLLVTALIASVVGWRTAVYRYEREIRKLTERKQVQHELDELIELNDGAADSPDWVRKKIEELRARIKSFDESK